MDILEIEQCLIGLEWKWKEIIAIEFKLNKSGLGLIGLELAWMKVNSASSGLIGLEQNWVSWLESIRID